MVKIHGKILVKRIKNKPGSILKTCKAIFVLIVKALLKMIVKDISSIFLDVVISHKWPLIGIICFFLDKTPSINSKPLIYCFWPSKAYSKIGVLISGGDVTSARLFVKMQGNREILGLVGYWDVVAWDEFEQQKGRNVDAVLIDTMQNYLANKSFNRGKATHEASASMTFVGNTKHTVPYMLKNSHLFESIPTSFIKGAF